MENLNKATIESNEKKQQQFKELFFDWLNDFLKTDRKYPLCKTFFEVPFCSEFMKDDFIKKNPMIKKNFTDYKFQINLINYCKHHKYKLSETVTSGEKRSIRLITIYRNKEHFFRHTNKNKKNHANLSI